MTRQFPRGDEQGVDAQIVAGAGITRRQCFRRGHHPAQPVIVQGEIRAFPCGARLDFDEGDHLAAPGDQVDLADGCAGACRQDVPAVQPELPGRKPLGPPPVALRPLAFHFSCWARS